MRLDVCILLYFFIYFFNIYELILHKKKFFLSQITSEHIVVTHRDVPNVYQITKKLLQKSIHKSMECVKKCEKRRFLKTGSV